jgi:peptide/nickel transport system ATP-binding protein
MTSAVSVAGLRVALDGAPFDIVDEIAFDMAPGEVVGLVGESGSGKTTVGLALLGHCRRGGHIAQGSVRIDGDDVLQLSPEALRAKRGVTVAYVPQDPGTALNPALRVGEQIEEMLLVHMPRLDADARQRRMAEMLTEVKLPPTAETLGRYPHQFSGGQQQRIALAMAFACRPRLIVLDEPTTGLDVTTQAHVLETVRGLCAQHGVAALYVSHDLAVVAGLAHRVAVMYAGRIVEFAAGENLFRQPRHPYTQRLLRAVPDPAGRRGIAGIAGHAPAPSARPPGCTFAPRCTLADDRCRHDFPPVTEPIPGHHVRCWHAGAAASSPAEASRASTAPGAPLIAISHLTASYGLVRVLHDIDLDLHQGECVALVGESGSGKTTLARCIAGLHAQHAPPVRLRERTLAPSVRARGKAERRAIQYVFQNPYASLNPRRTIGESIARPLHVFFDLSAAEIRHRVGASLERVALSPAMAIRYPDQLSGGERQRVAVARALAAEPELLVCDEITSALDVSVQAAIIEQLITLRREMGLAMLFVTHNLPLIRTIADRVAVMSAGLVVELGNTAAVFEAPQAEYTRELLANTPEFAFATEPAA